ncbi:MAG: winged helix-turn-helix domain-containing protein [Candidatus Thermoplasmatota archaeon]|nr:winged helix-turn-helix domain-containing protein [Candidatus Thermoplasmatota archaeon]
MDEETEEGRKRLIDSFRNQTKLSIIIVLLQNGKMTATQMSKIIGTSRSNLYQNLKEMVEDGILREPETRVKKNYVEKYYYPNTQLLEGFSVKQQEDLLNRKSPEELREYLISGINSEILRLKIMAREIEMKSDEEFTKQFNSKFFDQVLFSNSWLSRSTYEKMVARIREIFEEIYTEGELEEKQDESEDRYNVILIGIPKI